MSANKLIEIGLDIARSLGISRVTCTLAAQRANCSHGSILYHFGTVAEYRNAIVIQAIKSKDMDVLSNVVATKHDTINLMSADILRDVRNHLIGTLETSSEGN